MCIAPHVPAPPPPPPPAPDLPNMAPVKVNAPAGQQEAQNLAARLGTNQLIIPFANVNVPQ